MDASGGTIGALAGLGFGLAEYVVVTRMIGRAIAAETAQGGDLAGIGNFERRMRPIKAAMLAGAFVVMPAVGYVVGDAFGP
jgi:hypothetical protein